MSNISFVEDSAVKTFYSYALYHEVREIDFPASLNELNEEWCCETFDLINIINNYFVFKYNNYLLGKTDENEDEFDNFLFAKRNIREVSIPPNIKVISPYAFDMCRYLRAIEIPTNSNLQTNGSYAFTLAEVSEIYFPASLKELEKEWCCAMSRLRRINVSQLNKKFVFKDSIYLLGKTDENEDDYDILLFARRDIREISIPSNIKIIATNAFDHCCNLKKVEIPTNSNLQIIESNAFSCLK
ncbi:hypothetical protein M9Y10_000403 [Tritrichomonas musculus]|uniref:Leucine-rich repeat domain-containing protein n=1 Tax=Tritrichomonas musculus TaxID=1915356 RepID=A0ABR2L456_9EUKA